MPRSPDGGAAGSASVAGFGIVLFALLIALSLLPVANWIPGGHEAPWYSLVATGWLSGSALAIGGAVVLVILARRLPFLWRDGLASGAIAWAHRRPSAFAALIGAVAFFLYAVIAWRVLHARPVSIDDLVQLLQARIFAGGRLWQPVDANPAFHSILNVVDVNGRYYAQFPPGGPAMLMLGVLLGVPWLVGPACGALAVMAWWGAVRRVEPRAGVAVGAALLFGAAPFAAFMAGSQMNHTPTLMWGLCALLAVVRVREVEDGEGATGAGSLRWAFLSGVSLGAMATIRPVDALAFAMPVGVWYAARALRRPSRWRTAFTAAAGIAVPVAAMAWVNWHTTGEPLRFGYQVLWGNSVGLGFHPVPWGAPHTPARGLELVNLYLLRLQTYLFESPLPSLLPAFGAMLLARRLVWFDRLLLAVGGALLALYFAYWHDGFLFGPRFMLALAPLGALWTARLPALVRERWGQGDLHRGVVFALLVSGVVAVGSSVPARAAQYASGTISLRHDYLAPAREANIENAVILVRESWGSQLVARLWALGVPRSETEALYRTVDACTLDETIARLERSGARASTALQFLAPLMADSLRVVPSPWSPDRSERYLPGREYSTACRTRVAEDRAGFTLLAPLLVEDWGGNVYARDLHALNEQLVALHPGREWYLLRPADAESGTPPRLYPIDPDSARRDWSTAY